MANEMKDVCANVRGAEKSKIGAVKTSCRGHIQSSRECDAVLQLTPSADQKFAPERLQNHIEAAAAAWTGHPLGREAAGSDPQEQLMPQEGRQSR